MNTKSPFTIYDAAAGSGKTFTLVKEYLKLILLAKSNDYYKFILAITFTNKAVAEMKHRIVYNLVDFSEEDSVKDPSKMMIQIAEETSLGFRELYKKSKKILRHLLNHYSNFNVETIDSFNHRIIRTFARDLKLSGNFEVSIDTDSLLEEAVDQLITKAGSDTKITQILLEFTLEKIDDDKSWDISRDILATAGLIFNENDRFQVEKLKEKSLDDFIVFKIRLKEKKVSFKKKIIQIAEDTLQLIDESGLEFSDFSGKYLPKYFTNLKNGKFNLNLNAKWQNTLADKPLYPVRVLKETPEIAKTIDDLASDFIKSFKITKELISEELFITSLLINVNPLSVINLVSKEVEALKEAHNILPISEFNRLINNELKNQPTPFIYERLGEKFRHFFIDEFQDTSLLQWQNMIPLIDNAVSQQYLDGNSGSLLLVGDAKQSIYRWRGGLPEQFIELCKDQNPFQIEKKTLHLPVNYRSCKEIINFNNNFFTSSSSYFEEKDHQNLYLLGNQQKYNTKGGGYVKIEFVDAQNKEETQKVYGRKVLSTIQDLLLKGIKQKDVCILTRNTNDGITLGTYLLENGLTVISSETLLLQHSPKVQFLIHCLTLSIFEENEKVKVQFLAYLFDHLSIAKDKHLFFNSLLKLSLNELSNYFSQIQIDFSFKRLQSLSLYESFEYCIRRFNLNESSDAYLFGFMDTVYEFQQQSSVSKYAFLEDWVQKKEKLGVPVSENIEGVQLMTIHKAKGLEFPVVIYPYADLKIYDNKKSKSWYKLNPEDFEFEESLINYNKNVQEYGVQGMSIYQNVRNTLALDNLNLLYVALTRAISQLYIYSKNPTDLKGLKPTTYNQYFKEFIKQKGLWEEGKMTYEFGIPPTVKSNLKKEPQNTINPTFISICPKDHQLRVVSRDALLWDTEKEVAISSGNLLHKIMENIVNENDFKIVFDEIEQNFGISVEEKSFLKDQISKIIKHPKLNCYFNSLDQIINEGKIISKNGTVLIPDRLNFHKDKTVSIIDYKTGKPQSKHSYQLELYANALQEMNLKVKEKILIYCTSDGILINKV